MRVVVVVEVVVVVVVGVVGVVVWVVLESACDRFLDEEEEEGDAVVVVVVVVAFDLDDFIGVVSGVNVTTVVLRDGRDMRHCCCCC